MQPPLPVLFLNSTFLAIVITITNLVLGSVAGYCVRAAALPRA